MKKILFTAFSIATLIVLGLLINTNFNNDNTLSEADILREKHQEFLDNSPYNSTKILSRKERKAKGLAPNAYFERQWELTMDPGTGRPHPERLFELQDKLRKDRTYARVPGETEGTTWEERGPNNVSGRTRAIMFDPNDATNKRVFAGGVSGGLWVNDDITDGNSSWSLVDMPENLAISCITYDPNNINIFYVGTGESYVQGTVNGNGLWQSTNAGVTWSRVFGGISGETFYSSDAMLTVNSPGGIAGDYVALLATNFGDQLVTPVTGDLVLVDDGTGNTDDGCEALINGGAIAGNIAVILRGDCAFVDKVNNAQDAGAIAVIIVNNIGGPPVGMGGSDAGITIPTIMISKTDGDTIIAQLGSGVNATMESIIATNSGRYLTPGVQHINDVVVRNNGGISEVYVAASAAGNQDITPFGISLLGYEDYGLYKSTDEGGNWSQIDLPNGPGNDESVPNDIEIGANNDIWLSTTEIRGFGSDGSGTVLSSSDGNTFAVKTIVTNGLRTEIAVSSTDAGVVYVLAQLSTGPALALLKTTDGFGTAPTTINQPQDDDPAARLVNDFAGNQGGYNLVLEVDPVNEDILYVGGIDLFRSDDSGSTWSQLSHWYGGFGHQYAHADQHAISFGNSSSSTLLFSNDGGVFYSDDSGTTIVERNKDYNTMQFYKGAIGPDASPNERILGGAQDNGNYESGTSTTSGINSFNDINNGGDGAYVFVDDDKQYMIASYVFNSFYYKLYANPTSALGRYTIIEDTNSGDFINPAGLDDINDFFYTNGTAGATFKINRYELNSSPGVATETYLTDDLLDGAPTAFKASAFTSTTLFVGTDNGKLLKLTDATTSPSWSDISGADFYGSISCVEFGTTENDIYVTFYNYGVTSIFYTADGGANWVSKEGDFPDIPVRAIMVNPLSQNEVIIGTNLGVWATPDISVSSPNWYQSQNGMKDVKVTSFDLRVVDNVVLASTYGRGMFTGQFTADASGLSVTEFALNNLIKVYPTVSNGEITIAPMNETREGRLAIFDINGREVYNYNLDFNGGARNLSLNLSSGMYIVKFSTDELQSTHKIIIE